MTPSPTGLEALIGALEDFQVGYLIGGSVASSVYGRFRATNDVDILAALDANQVRSLIQRLTTEFVAFEDEILSAILAGRSFNLIHRRTVNKFDIFPARTAFEREQLQRARRLPVSFFEATLNVAVASPEDIVLAKLLWFRMGGETSERQLSDVRGVIEIQTGKLDLEYMKRWARELGIQDLLARVEVTER